MKQLPRVVIVGRMNVGKSTLFNRLSSTVKSLTLDYRGVTRDVLCDVVEWRGRSFELVDTGGLAAVQAIQSQDPLLQKVWEKAWASVQKAQVVIFVGDGTVGVVAEDREIIRQLHRWGKKIIVVMNKSDVKHVADQIYEFQSLGGCSVIAVSAEHGKGIGDLLDEIVAQLPLCGSFECEEPQYRVVLLGRPNVGKSSLMNHIVREERSIVFDQPGTTREAISQPVMFYKESIMVTDTPGLRRKSTISQELEEEMVYSSLQALDRAKIVVLVVDGTEGTLVDQDLKLGFYAFAERFKALIVVVNKSDLMSEDEETALESRCVEYEYFLKKIPVKTISCLTGKNVGTLLPLMQEVWERHNQTLPSQSIYHLFMREMEKRPLIRHEQRLIVYGLEQIGSAPITFRMLVNEPLWFGKTQLSFFENILRKQYDLRGVPVRFIVRKFKNKGS